MATIPLLLVFFGGLLLFFLIGRLLGHIIGLDKYFPKDESPDTSGHNKSERRKKRKVKNKKDSLLNGLKSSAGNMEYPGHEYVENSRINK
ncbi:MAG TPA: hypothetical protein VK155_18160 [Bacteroidales bacterium]|jgi:hypothetical protein|nr:hypothetical protein [Bacteroidales bacterium]